MKIVTAIGIDLAKNSFSVYGVDATGKPVLSRTLGRTGVVRFFADLPACLVGMEARASSCTPFATGLSRWMFTSQFHTTA